MSIVLKPNFWHKAEDVNGEDRYIHSFLLYAPEFVCMDFNPAGVIEGHWSDSEGWQGAVWCGHHDEYHTKPVKPDLVMITPVPALDKPRSGKRFYLIEEGEAQVTVSGIALQRVLAAAVSSPHLLREMVATRGLPCAPGLPANPLDVLANQFNDQVYPEGN